MVNPSESPVAQSDVFFLRAELLPELQAEDETSRPGEHFMGLVFEYADIF